MKVLISNDYIRLCKNFDVAISITINTVLFANHAIILFNVLI